MKLITPAALFLVVLIILPLGCLGSEEEDIDIEPVFPDDDTE